MNKFYELQGRGLKVKLVRMSSFCLQNDGKKWFTKFESFYSIYTASSERFERRHGVGSKVFFYFFGTTDINIFL